MMTAFCSSHDRSRDSGRPFTSVPNTWGAGRRERAGRKVGTCEERTNQEGAAPWQDTSQEQQKPPLTSASLEATTMAE